jgi:hypothetical protein
MRESLDEVRSLTADGGRLGGASGEPVTHAA